MELIYNGKNIYSGVKLRECIYDSRCDNNLSRLRIVFYDDNHKYDMYGFKLGDAIRIKDGDVDTKELFINEINPVNARYEIVANPIKKEEMIESDTKEWKSVKFKKVISEIASKHGLTVKYYGVSDYTYKKLEQKNEGDIKFATRLAILEGCMIVIFDKMFVVASQDYLKKQRADIFEIDEYDVKMKKHTVYKKCEVKGDKITGKYSGESGSGTFTCLIDISSIAEGNRFAKNLLSFKNQNAYTGCITTDKLLEGYSGGSTVKIKSKDHPSAEGNAMIYRVRHDLINGKSKIWFRRMEG